MAAAKKEEQEEVDAARTRRLELRRPKEDLFAAVAEFFEDPTIATEGLMHRRLHDETYGDDSHVYIACEGVEQREALEDAIEQAGGFEVHRDYSPAHGGRPKGRTASVGVAYYKGWHWDE